MPEHFKGKTINELKLRQATGSNIIGFRKSNGEYVVNPGPETKIESGTSLIVLGNHQQLKRLKEQYILNQ